MNMLPKKEIIEEVAQIKGISEAFIEKDWFVTQVIKLLSNVHFQDFSIVFTGGTALSKAHGLLERFSEDIDFRVIAPSLAAQSKSQQGKILSTFKKEVVERLQAEFPVNEEQITARNGNKFIAIELNYSTYFTRADALRPHILLELTVSDLLLPVINLPVSSIINQVAKKPAEIETIACINPVENAADKLSAISWRIAERVRGSENDSPDIVRHIHDLAILGKLALNNANFPKLVIAALERDKNRSELIKELSMGEKFSKMIGILETDAEYPKEYRRFVNAMSYAENDTIPTFQKAVESVRLLIEVVN
jgi:Nucleotidyl transferase AbiEii toxin, Type IV TA system